MLFPALYRDASCQPVVRVSWQKRHLSSIGHTITCYSFLQDFFWVNDEWRLAAAYACGRRE